MKFGLGSRTVAFVLLGLGLGAVGCDGEQNPGSPDAGAPDGGGDGGVTIDTRCVPASTSGAPGTGDITEGPYQAKVVLQNRDSCTRNYVFYTNAPLRDNLPSNPRLIREYTSWPVVRTGNDYFDGLYALTLEESRELQVGTLRDGSFNNGQPLACPEGGCFETGRIWNYVWTRDTAYSVNLGLAPLDPMRARNSLTFKTSERRAGGDRQIIQDTGSGGSYPISSDRVVWAMGAWELLKYLPEPDRTSFRDLAYEAIVNTIEHDRVVVYDPRDGLYRGEQSFLDWREQSYPAWTADNTVHIGMSKSLSTNIAHVFALDVASRLAEEKGDAAARDRYATWAASLRAAVREFFYLPDQKLFSAFSTTFLDPSPTRQFDLLGEAFAVLMDIADPAQAAEVVASYPHVPKGPSVIWPQQQETRIYHNRAIWPFATAFWLRAAQKVRNDAVASHTIASLMRGAALNLSNMENFEMTSGRAFVNDGVYSGPVVNSQRQLWSVAGYLSMVHDVIFGIDVGQTGIRFRPYLPRRVRNTTFAGTDRIAISNFPYLGRKISVLVRLPAVSENNAGAYAVGAVKLNGQTVSSDYLTADAFRAGEPNLVEVELVDTPEVGASIRLLDDSQLADYRNHFGPRLPLLQNVAVANGRLQLTIDPNREQPGAIAFNIYRDGVRVASDLPGSTTTWTDPNSLDYSRKSYCYAVESYFLASGNASQHSLPRCFWGTQNERIATVAATQFQATGGTLTTEYGRTFYGSWGDPGHQFVVPSFTANFTGEHLLQVVAGNGAGSVTTGITCGVKLIEVRDPNNQVVGSGYLLMPHLGTWDRFGDSSFVRANLVRGQTYRITIRNDERSNNMSVFQHFAAYNGTGGSSGPFNRANIAELKVLARENN